MYADLSIVITNYNKPKKQLIECVESVKAQTVPPKEVILVDDCSKVANAHGYATSIILPKNVGVSEARDVGVKMSKQKLLLFVDADDKLAPDFIEQCGRVIAKCDIAYPNLLLFGDIENNRLSDAPPRLRPVNLMSKKCQIPVTSMMHRYVYEKLNGFKKMPLFEDWDFWLRSMLNGYTFKRANTLLYYRQNKTSRNRASLGFKTTIYNNMISNYQVKNGILIERRKNGPIPLKIIQRSK